MACVPSELEVVPRLKPKLGNSWHPCLLWSMWSFVEQEAVPLGAQTSSHRSTVLFKVRSHGCGAAPVWVFSALTARMGEVAQGFGSKNLYL